MYSTGQKFLGCVLATKVHARADSHGDWRARAKKANRTETSKEGAQAAREDNGEGDGTSVDYSSFNINLPIRPPHIARKSEIGTFGQTELYAAFPARIRQFRCVS